jgi:hypothetical protein
MVRRDADAHLGSHSVVGIIHDGVVAVVVSPVIVIVAVRLCPVRCAAQIAGIEIIVIVVVVVVVIVPMAHVVVLRSSILFRGTYLSNQCIIENLPHFFLF